MLRKWGGLALIAIGVLVGLPSLLMLSDGTTGTVAIVMLALSMAALVGGWMLTSSGEKAIAADVTEETVTHLRTNGLPVETPGQASAAEAAGALDPVVREKLRRLLAEGRIPMAPSDAGYACVLCGLEAETRKVSLYRNTGLLVAHKTLTVEGYLCRLCIGRTAGTFTGHNLVLGWWSLHSFFITLGAIPNNLFHWARSRSMVSPPLVAAPLALAPADAALLAPFAAVMADLLAREMDPAEVIRTTAEKTRTTPGSVALFLRSLAGAKEPVPA